MGLGKNTLRQANVDSIIERYTVRIDTSAGINRTLLLFDPIRDLIIDTISLSYDVLGDTGAANALNIGTAGTATAVVAITHSIVAANNAAGVIETWAGGPSDIFVSSTALLTGVSTITVGTTYLSTRNGRDRGKQQIPAGTPIYAILAADSNVTELTAIVCAYALDSTSIK